MWFRVDDGFVDHVKTIRAADRLGGPHSVARVVAVWLECGIYCSRQLTDGFVPARIVRHLLSDDAALDVADALVAVGLWEAVPDGYHFHDWHDYQENGTTVRERRNRDRARKRSARIPRGHTADKVAPNPAAAPTLSARNPRGQNVPVLRSRSRSRSKAKDQGPPSPRPPAACTVWEVRPHLLAAVHRTLEQGDPYVDSRGSPLMAELMAEIKTIASRSLGAEWRGRELDAIVTAALARRADVLAAERARERFAAREWQTIAAARGGRP